MKFETSSGNNFNQLLINFKIPFLEKEIYFRTQIINTPNETVLGYGSRTLKGLNVLLFDYDHLELFDIENELKYLQKRFKLSDIFIFKLDRENSWHAICLDVFPIAEAFTILKQSSCDSAFINAITSLNSREWILRVGRKGSRLAPVFDHIILSKYNKRVKSLAHRDFLINHFGLKKAYFTGKFDGCKEIGLTVYTTANRIK